MLGHMDCYGHTDCGTARSNNEDQFLIAETCQSARVHQSSLAFEPQTRMFGKTAGKILAVADGLGGHRGGERASQLAIDGFLDHLLNDFDRPTTCQPLDQEEIHDQLDAAVLRGQQKILREADLSPETEGMGTTLTAAFVQWPHMYLKHVGDSRCYILRDNTLNCLTEDHTYGELARKFKQTTASHAENATPHNRILWNALGGTSTEPEIASKSLSLQIGDCLLFVTDGVHQQVAHHRIRDVLASSESAKDACLQLTNEANEAGGIDNATAIVCRFEELDSQLRYDEEMDAQTAVKLWDDVAGDTVEFDSCAAVKPIND